MRIKSVVFVGALTIFLVVCDVHISEHNRYNPNILHQDDKESTTPSRTRTNIDYNNEGHTTHKQNKRSMLTKSDNEDIPIDKIHNKAARKVRHHHGENPSEKPVKTPRKRKGRCRRYAQRYYQPYQGMPVYVPKYNQQNYLAPSYVPPQYVVPSYYSSMCRSYCVPCVTSTCRRRCPYFPGSSTTKSTHPGTKPTATITVTSADVTKTSTKPTATITVVTKPPCNCNEAGSKSQTCDNTGTCLCKPNYIGEICDRCKDGYWKNRNKDCVYCNCNKYGSIPNSFCDKTTGRCHCKEGVTGAACDSCKSLYYGITKEGCIACNCNQDGSQFQTCNSTGDCLCRPNYNGKTCATCKDGYWKNRNKDCVKCECNKYGSVPNTFCDKTSGRCHCKEGVTGATCNACKPHHYGTIEKGCKECDPCDKPGHICDPQNGKCVCPSLTAGDNCRQCAQGAWGYVPGTGCKLCQCSQNGSLSSHCNTVNGKCDCKTGYEGEKCEKCSFSYYGYPNCKKCNCNLLGTNKEDCQDSNCKCNDNGTCRCKENVQGTKCDACKLKTFSLTKENLKGCTQCFCFGRSKRCVDAQLNWDKIRVNKINNKSKRQAINNDYWKLPNKFMGDLTTSYGGYLTVDQGQGYFTVKLEGNGVGLQSSSSSNELQLVESNWNIEFRNPQFPNSCQSKLTRSCFMVVLQNVTSFLVEANNRINEVLLDKAKPNLPTYPPAHSIERCECPKEYTGLSCQDPNVGYFRYFSNDTKDKWIDIVVGKAKLCECNNRSQSCDPNTGFCKNCTHSTSGNHCELCDTGYYKDVSGNCSPCLCPTASQNNAESCSPIEKSFKCNCKKGYMGQFCDQCDDGYFDKDVSPKSLICEPCGCNPFGVVDGKGESCNEFGICQCKEGFKGEKCNECVNEREYIKNGVCSPCDECVKLLFSEIDNLTLAVDDTFNLFKSDVKPPWKLLTNTIDKHNMLSEKFKRKKEQTDNLLQNSKLDQLKEKINAMKERLKQKNDEAKTNIINTDKLQNSSNSLVDEIQKLNTKLINIIETLDNSGPKSTNVKNSLKKAKEILKQINAISKKFNNQEDQEAVNYCKNVTQKINDIYKPPSNMPKQLLEDLNNKLDDLSDITADVEKLVNKAEKKNLDNADRIVKFKEKLETLKNNSRGVEDSVREIMSKINATDDLILQLEVVYNDLKNITNFMEFKQLENRVRRQMEDSPKTNELFFKAIDHVRELEKKINSYQSLFNFTKDEWKKINASGSYETLLHGIEEAKRDIELSRKLLEDATKLIYPANSENVLDKANLALTYSEKIKQRINNLKNISKNLTEVKNKLDKFKYSILSSGKANNDLNQILHKMETDITSQADVVSKLEDAIKNSKVISEDMEQIRKKVQDILTASQDSFFNKYNMYLNLISKEEIDKLKAKLNNTREHLKNLNISSTYFDTIKKFNTENKNRNIQDIQARIEELTNKINYAKQAADIISVAMNISNCHMSYQLPQMEVFKSLSITFKCKTCQIFKLANADGEFNLAVENNNIILKFNDKNIVISSTEKDKEKTVNIEKLGSLIKMQVDTIEKTELTDSPYYIIHPYDQIEIGSTNNKINGKSYVYNVILNQKKFGLWKFSQTEGNCTGETRDETEKQPDNVNTFFNGKGYVTYGKNSNLNPTKLTLGFDFSTFDENSLIYLAAFDETTTISKGDNCAYIILYLKNGYLNLIVKHSNGLSSTLASDNKSNNGRKHHVDINMEYDKSGVQYYILLTKNETLENIKDTTNALNKKYVFKIKQASHYLGGTPPVYNKTCLPINTTSFLGFLKVTTPLTNEILSYGTIKTNKQVLEFYQVQVNKNGYMKVKLMEEQVQNISFILQPTSANGIIMNLAHYNISLDNYRLKIVGMENDHNISLDANEYNTVNISYKEGILVVNSNEKVIQVPTEVNIVDLIITLGDKYKGFSGGLSNILINNKELLFTPNGVVEFSNVEIGRELPSIKVRSTKKAVKSLSTYFTNTMLNTESCARPSNYETISEAIKLGDTSNSYTYIKSNFWKTDYSVSFQFRTYYPHGLLFISIGNQKQQHYNLLKLTDGELSLNIKGKINKSPVILNGKLNNGQWHSVELSKKKRKLAIAVNGQQKKIVKIPKTAVRNEIYIGGVPSNSDYLQVTGLGELDPFKGCLRSLIINNEHQFIKTKDVQHSNTDQCFSNVEEGAYFSGSSFAIFKENLKINKIVELFFEFKTTEQNGIFLSVSNFGNGPGLSVELQNGAVVMTVDMGNGVISHAKNNLFSKFALCNNMWHNVTAMYSSSELTVFVDGIRQTWAQSITNSLLDEISAPIYIGGFPGDAPAETRKSRRNFNGCLRRLKIENTLIDWSNMRELYKVSLNSCPT